MASLIWQQNGDSLSKTRQASKQAARPDQIAFLRVKSISAYVKRISSSSRV